MYARVKHSHTSACMCTPLPAVLSLGGGPGCGGPGCGGRGGTVPAVSGRGNDIQGMKLWKCACFQLYHY